MNEPELKQPIINQCITALKTAISSVECASICPNTKQKLPWYKQAMSAIAEYELMKEMSQPMNSKFLSLASTPQYRAFVHELNTRGVDVDAKAKQIHDLVLTENWNLMSQYRIDFWKAIARAVLFMEAETLPTF